LTYLCIFRIPVKHGGLRAKMRSEAANIEQSGFSKHRWRWAVNYPVTLFAQGVRESGVLELILRPETLVFMIPIAAIVGGIAFAITKAIIAHRERMARIQQGFDPDERGHSQ
jgi:hypothetical protein